jgi:hypothetical protein
MSENNGRTAVTIGEIPVAIARSENGARGSTQAMLIDHAERILGVAIALVSS